MMIKIAKGFWVHDLIWFGLIKPQSRTKTRKVRRRQKEKRKRNE